MQAFEVVPGLQMTRQAVEVMIEASIENGNFEAVERLLAMIDDADGDPDFEDHPVHGQHSGAEPDEGDYEWDARNGDKPPLDPLTGFDVIQDEWKTYPAQGGEAI